MVDRCIKKSGYFKEEMDCKPIIFFFFLMMNAYYNVIECALKHKLVTEKQILFFFQQIMPKKIYQQLNDLNFLHKFVIVWIF